MDTSTPPSTPPSIRTRRSLTQRCGTIPTALAIAIPALASIPDKNDRDVTLLAKQMDRTRFFDSADAAAPNDGSSKLNLDDPSTLPSLPNTDVFERQFNDERTRSMYLANLFSMGENYLNHKSTADVRILLKDNASDTLFEHLSHSIYLKTTSHQFRIELLGNNSLLSHGDKITTMQIQIPHPIVFGDVLSFLYTGDSKLKGRKLEMLIANCFELGVDYDVMTRLQDLGGASPF
ncbi:hypothetical protein SeMB42_g05224 [Synchytrium endobioticum]|uniref:BTB domain-containing protein n=1 Tax=Synchytrium endobioticum TaxID=286115 RepID=A0A507CST0_9FUNG|nr:hypothetical protein SeMB42_g05224 [Synchytrium endobioticum]TPX47311.1 hypothetical protein SeLEV6574_g02739 [Synchytrium endobioticum]